MGKKSRMMANGECRTGGLSFVFFHLIVFPLPPKLVMQVSFLKSASVWILLPWRWGDEQQCVYMCAYSSSFSSSPASLYSFFCRSVPLLNLASHDPRLAGPLLVWKRQGKSQMAEWGCGWLKATVYTSQLPLRSRLNSVKPLCLHAPFTAIWMCWMLLHCCCCCFFTGDTFGSFFPSQAFIRSACTQ